MAVRTQPLAALQKENAEIKRDKTTVPLSDRKALATITNKLKPPNSGLATSICPHKAENNTRGGAVSGSFSCAKNGRMGIVARAALGNITNGVESFKAPEIVAKQRKGQGKIMKMGPNPRNELTEEEKQKAYAWAGEGIERVQFSGKDMEALKERIAEGEVHRRVAQALSYRTEIPCFLPRAFQKDPHEITDDLKLVSPEDLCKKGDSPCDDMKLEDVDYDEFSVECPEVLQNASKNWPGVLEDCV